jgi:threonine aldolase
MTRLAAGLRRLPVEFVDEPAVNMLFARLDPDAIDRMADAGLLFYREEAHDMVRLVTSFQTTDADVDEALTRIEAALAG